jgi:transcriptional regulator with XRE-family HTH domain
MPKRPVFHPQIGKFFAELRERKGFTQRQAGALAERRKLPGLTRQVLWRLEAGRTKNPEPEVFRAIAELYEESYEEVIAKWVVYRYGVSDLIGHGVGTGSAAPPLSGGAVDGPAQARILELERQLADHQAQMREVRALTARLVELATRGGEDGAAAQPQARRRSAVRKSRG